MADFWEPREIINKSDVSGFESETKDWENNQLKK